MRHKKVDKYTGLEVSFSRGFLQKDSPKDFYRLLIRASIGENNENYDYVNWTEEDLKDLADAIYAFIRELHKK